VRGPIEDGAYDAALVHFTLHDIDKMIRLETVKALCRKLKPAARLFLREPTVKFGAMPIAAMRGVLTRGGFKEQFARRTSAPLLGHMYEAVYLKSAA